MEQSLYMSASVYPLSVEGGKLVHLSCLKSFELSLDCNAAKKCTLTHHIAV